jgi:S-adenosylmethionine/arginine decarboxylase-like enzyme
MKDKSWGQLLSVDLAGCNLNLINNKDSLKKFCSQICDEIDMIAFGEPLIQRFGKGDLEGFSLMQFIETSSITAHMDETEKRAFIDIFSCKKFNSKKASDFCKNFFQAKEMKTNNLYRG